MRAAVSNEGEAARVQLLWRAGGAWVRRDARGVIGYLDRAGTGESIQSGWG